MLKPVPEGAGFASGDWALCDLVAKAGDEVVKEMKDVPVGGDPVAVRGFQIDGLAAGIEGKKAGESSRSTASWPGRHMMHDHDHDHDQSTRSHEHAPRDQAGACHASR